MTRKPGMVEKQILKKIIGYVPTEYLKAIRTAADVALVRRQREEGK